MNKRISNKVYNRANKRLLSYIHEHNDDRTILEVELQEKILTPLERKVFSKRRKQLQNKFKEIEVELTKEGLIKQKGQTDGN